MDVPQLDPRWDEFYFGDYLDQVVVKEERRYREKRDPSQGRFAAIRAELTFVFPVTSLFCHLAAAYEAFGFPRVEDRPESIMNREFGWWLQRFLQRKLKDITFMTWDQGGLEDWDYGIVGIPDALFLTLRSRRRVLVDYKKRLDFPFKKITRRGIPTNLLKTRFYPPSRQEWKQMQLLLYLLRQYKLEEYDGQPIRFTVILSLDPGFHKKHSLVVYDEKWVREELDRVRGLREACFDIKLQAGADLAKVKQLIENDPRIQKLPLEADEHGWCGHRDKCPVGQLYLQATRAGRNKTPEWVRAKRRREYRVRQQQLPPAILREESEPQQVFLLDPNDPGVTQIRDKRRARLVTRTGQHLTGGPTGGA
jgi:hypothetical protein